jgi:hypothetical protein
MFKIVQARFGRLGITFNFANRIYLAMGGFGDNRNLALGNATLYPTHFIGLINKAQLKGKDEVHLDDVKEMRDSVTGISVGLRVRKNRKAKIQDTLHRLYISFYNMMNPFKGLEDFVSWEACGIQSGKLVQLKKKELESYDPTDINIVEQVGESGEIENVYRFIPSDGAHTYAVRHLCQEVPKRDIYNMRVFNENVLRDLDEKVIKPMFALPKTENIDGEEYQSYKGEEDSKLDELIDNE